MSLYCAHCTQGNSWTERVPSGASACGRCGRSDHLRCLGCNQLIPVGMSHCPKCDGQVRSLALPDLPAVGLAIPTVVPVPERYQGGRFGVEAEVTMPAKDAAILNELAALVPVLHVVAGRLAQFTILNDHTRKLVRDLRLVATDAQEEIELRRGPA